MQIELGNMNGNNLFWWFDPCKTHFNQESLVSGSLFHHSTAQIPQKWLDIQGTSTYPTYPWIQSWYMSTSYSSSDHSKGIYVADSPRLTCSLWLQRCKITEQYLEVCIILRLTSSSTKNGGCSTLPPFNCAIEMTIEMHMAQKKMLTSAERTGETSTNQDIFLGGKIQRPLW